MSRHRGSGQVRDVKLAASPPRFAHRVTDSHRFELLPNCRSLILDGAGWVVHVRNLTAAVKPPAAAELRLISQLRGCLHDQQISKPCLELAEALTVPQQGNNTNRNPVRPATLFPAAANARESPLVIINI